jgi:hypothetical protein
MRFALPTALSLLLSVACSLTGEAPAEDAAAVEMRQSIERELATMSPGVADLIRQQPWFKKPLKAGHHALVLALKGADSAVAVGRMALGDVVRLVELAEEANWYKDGLTEQEASALAAIYRLALPSQLFYAPQSLELPHDFIEELGETLAEQQFREVATEGGLGTLVVVFGGSSSRERTRTLSLTVHTLTRLEELLGDHQRAVLYVQIDDGLVNAGEARRDVIVVQPDYAERDVLAHEITHTMFIDNRYPFWFKEGIAHFFEWQVVDRLDDEYRSQSSDLAAKGVGRGPFINRDPVGTRDQAIDRIRGFLLLKDIYDILGDSAFTSAVKELRWMHAFDLETVGVFYDAALDDSQRAKLAGLFCDTFSVYDPALRSAQNLITRRYCPALSPD